MSDNAKSAEWYRKTYTDISGNTVIGAADGDATLVTVKTPTAGSGEGAYTLFIQRIIVWISTDAAQSWSFEDNNGTPKQIAEIPASPGDSTRWDFDFGAAGIPLTEAKNFVLNVSAAGLAGNIAWEGYTRMTGAAYLDTVSR